MSLLDLISPLPSQMPVESVSLVALGESFLSSHLSIDSDTDSNEPPGTLLSSLRSRLMSSRLASTTRTPPLA